MGGGVAAAAALAGASAGPAAADATPASTVAHAQSLLTLVDPGLGLVNAAGLQSRFAESFTAYTATLPTQTRDPVPTSGLDSWSQTRMVDLCETDSPTAAITKIPQTRTLLSFSFLACSQGQDIPMPQIAYGMEVPTALQTLEPDFFPVLLDQIADKKTSNPGFAKAMLNSSAAMDQYVAQNVRPDGTLIGPTTLANNGAAGAVFFGVFIAAGLVYTWVRQSICNK